MRDSVTRSVSRDLAARIVRVRLLALDVDGVLTDGAILVTGQTDTARFHVHDGLGIERVMRAGVSVTWITGRRSDAVLKRAAELGVSDVRQGVAEKGEELRRAADVHGLVQAEVAYMGDDLPDLPAISWASVSFAPADAVAPVRRAADVVCERTGGHGAVREVCDLILALRLDGSR
jgi:3-deoxy-D-manno-octulosonate 8-phosphate phosphatase (KDO 8-P phosphatase)